MFNEERKLEWISNLEMKETTKSTMTTYMNRIANYESSLNKDCSEFTKEEVLEFYREYDTSSVASISNMNSKYKVYTEWCLEKGYTKTNSYAELTVRDWEDCVVKVSPIITREELISLFTGYTSKIFNPSDQLLCLALFEGICGTGMSELLNLTIKDFEGNTVHLCSGRTLTVSDKLVELAKETDTLYEKTTYGVARSTRALKDEKYIFKSAVNSFSSRDAARIYNLRMALTNCRKETGVDAINQLSLIESGRIYTIKQYMKLDGYTKWEDAFRAYAKEINYRYQPELKTDKLVAYARKYGEYLT